MRRRLTVLLLLVVACSTVSSSDDDGFALSEWAVDGPDRIQAGTATLAVENKGEWSHTLLVTSDSGDVVASAGLIESGASATFEVDLAPGVYVFSCRIVAEDDEGGVSDHYQQGMGRTVTVTA